METGRRPEANALASSGVRRSRPRDHAPFDICAPAPASTFIMSAIASPTYSRASRTGLPTARAYRSAIAVILCSSRSRRTCVETPVIAARVMTVGRRLCSRTSRVPRRRRRRQRPRVPSCTRWACCDRWKVMHAAPGPCRRQDESGGVESDVFSPDAEGFADAKAGDGGKPDGGERGGAARLGSLERARQRRQLGGREGCGLGVLRGRARWRARGWSFAGATPSSRTR